MNCAELVAGHVNGETVVAAGLFQRRGTAAAIGDDGGLPAGADPEREAPGFRRTRFSPQAGGAPSGDGCACAKLDARESSLNYLEIVGTWELLLTFPDGRSAAFECSKRNDDCKATCRAIAGGAAEVARNLPRPRSLDPDFTDWDPEDMDTWDERIVLVADDEDFLEWQRDWLTDHGRA